MRLSRKIQNLLALLVTAGYGSVQPVDEVDIAVVACDDLKSKITYKPIDSAAIRRRSALGAKIADMDDVFSSEYQTEILMPYGD